MILAFAGVSIFILLVRVVVVAVVAAGVLGAGMGRQRQRTDEGGPTDDRRRRPRHAEVHDDAERSARPRA